MTLDFTLEKYTELCQTIQHLECPIMTVRDFLRAEQPGDLRIILRHDVDRRIGAAIRMAELESAYSIAATYYVRMTRAVFKPEAIRRLHALGHEVGYHYEVLAKAKGDTERAIALFEKELNRLRDVVPVETVSMHGSPLSRWSNLALWETHNIQDCDILGDAVLSIDSVNLYYATDTGRSWNPKTYNLRDHVASRELPKHLQTTDSLIDFMVQKPNCPIYISAHPNRWAANRLTWTLGTVSDWAINQIKWAINLTRSSRN